jgi:pyruvate,water dikinase
MPHPIGREFDEIGLADRDEVGAKAAVLGHLRRSGLPVPRGFVVTNVDIWEAAFRRDPASALPAWAASRIADGSWIARSSATVEDGGRASFAGQFRSLPDLIGADELCRGVRSASQVTPGATEYAGLQGIDAFEGQCPVLVQPMVSAIRAGVLFTVDPLGRERGRFALDWTDPRDGLVTDGASRDNLLLLDPLDLRDFSAASTSDVVLRRAAPRLIDLAFRTLDSFDEVRPLDLEWVIDGDERLWLVQARPVTTSTAMVHPEVERLLAQGWWLPSRRPVSRLARCAYLEAALVDKKAAIAHHAHVDRVTVSSWLLGRREARTRRPRIAASKPSSFVLRWLWVRRGNLVFALRHLPGWFAATWVRSRRAERTLTTELTVLTDGELTATLRATLRDLFAVRRVHAALWYPVDLAKDVEEFGDRFGWPGLARGIDRPRRRRRRDESAARLIREIRSAHGDHPAWEELIPAERQRIREHLARYPFAFERAEEVQDLALWPSYAERPAEWWELGRHRDDEDLDSALSTSAPEPPGPAPTAAVCFWGKVLRVIPGIFSPLKDDRAELWAQAASAARAVSLELGRRAGIVGRRVFELSPQELELLARSLPDRARVRRLADVALRRCRERLIEELAAYGSRREPAERSTGGEGAFCGRSISGGVARGRAREVASVAEALRTFRRGEVLVTDEVCPALAQVMPRASALVCRRGSPLSHGAIVAREMGIPAVVLGDLAGRIKTGSFLEVDGDNGAVLVILGERKA